MTDLIIIGAGPGGYRAAEYAAKNGLKVVIFEGRNVGGTCLNHGCIPTKAFAHDAEMGERLRVDGGKWKANGEEWKVDFQQVVDRKNQVVENLRNGIEMLLSPEAITLIRQKASFVDSHTVKDEDGNLYSAPNIIIATGSVSKMIPLEECDSQKILDAEGLLDITQLPHSLCIIGAGVIGMEFASIFNAFGVKVKVVEFLRECLPVLDADIAKRLRKSLEKRGIDFFMQSKVKAVTKDGVCFEQKGKQLTVEADKVLMAVGRAPRVSDDFANAGFDYTQNKGVTTDEHFRTSVSGIYAIGDVNGRQMLAHAAEMQGTHVVNQILGKTDNIHFNIMPAAIFTYPEAACVGLTEEQCKERCPDYACHKSFYRANGKALSMNESEGLVKLFTDKEGRIIGCHAMGAHAADLVQEASVLMCKNCSIDELRDMIHIHPSLSEILHDC